MIAILLVGTLILFVALGVPIAFSIVLAAASGILIGGVSSRSNTNANVWRGQ